MSQSIRSNNESRLGTLSLVSISTLIMLPICHTRKKEVKCALPLF